MSNFEDLLNSLREEYLDSLPAKIDLVGRQIQDGATPPLRDSFHKLKGTGRTYGLPEVSELAEVSEAVCIDRPENALVAAALSVELLKDIHGARRKACAFPLSDDPRFQSLRKLLQK